MSQSDCCDLQTTKSDQVRDTGTELSEWNVTCWLKSFHISYMSLIDISFAAT